MRDKISSRVAMFLMIAAFLIGATLSSLITWYTVIDNGPPLSCIERDGVIVIEGPASVKCVVPD